MNSWYIYSKNHCKKYGPYSSDQLKRMIQEKSIDDNCTISNDGVTWHNVNEIASKFTNLPTQKKMGKFEIIKELGRGGMGVVYHARDIYLQYECAVKFIRMDQESNSATKRFITEAQSIAKLNHPNIIKIKELNNCVDAQGNNLYYFSMDYIKGIPFDEYMRKSIPLKKKLKLFYAVCQGVAYAHKHKIIHRDLKPQNIIVSEQEVPIILDFGLARNLDKTDNITKTGDIIGTPKYIAPEIMRGEKAGKECDVYALGVILYEMLTGHSPFSGENAIEILFQVSHTEPIPPSKANNSIKKDSDIEIICLKCLEKKPKNRILSAAFLCEELKSIINGKPTKTKPPSFLSRTLIVFKENPKGVLATIILFIISLLGFWAYMNKSYEDKRRNKEVSILNSETMNQNVMQFYEKFSQPKGMNSILSNMEKQYSLLEKYIEDNYKQALLSQKQKILDFLDRTQITMKYFVLSSIPKTKHNIELENIHNAMQIKISATNYIAVLDEKQNLFLRQINQEKSNLSLEKTFTTRCSKFFFSPNGKWLATLELDDSNLNRSVCRLYKVKQKKLILTKEVNNNSKVSLAFSPSSNYLAYNNTDNDVSIINLNTKVMSIIENENLAVYFSFSPDSKHLLYKVGDKNYFIYNLQQRSSNNSIKYHSDYPIWRSPDELVFFTAGHTEIYNIKTKKFKIQNLDEFDYDNVTTSAISPDRKTLMWGSENGYIHYIKIEKNRAKVKRKKQSPGRINQIEFINSYLFFTKDHSNHFYLRSLSSKEIVYRKAKVVYAKKVNDDVVAVVKENGKLFIKYWNTSYLLAQKLRPSKKESKTIDTISKKFADIFTSHNCLFIEKDNSLNTVILPLSKGFSIWKKQGDHYQHILKTSILFDIWSPKISNDQKWLASIVHFKKLRKQQVILIENDKILQLDLQNGEKIIDGKKVHGQHVEQWKNNKFDNNAEIRALDFTPNNNLLFSYDNELWQYSISKKSVKKIVAVSSKIQSIQTHRKLNIIAVGQQKNQLHLISANGEIVFQPKIKERKGYIKKISWHPSLPICATLNDQGQIYLLNRKSSNWSFEKIDILGNKSNISFSPNDDVLAIFTLGETYIYSLKTKKYVPIFSGYYKNQGANFSDDWKYAAFPSKKINILLFDLHKLNFSYFPEHFATKEPLQYQRKDPIWPRRVQQKFLNYLKSK